MKSKAPNQPDFGLQYDADGMILDPHPPLSFDPDAMSSLACKTPNLEMRPMNAPKLPIEMNKHEAAIGLIWEQIRIAIDQMPLPVGEADDARLAAAEAKMEEVLDTLCSTR